MLFNCVALCLLCASGFAAGIGTEADGKTFWLQQAQQTLQDTLAIQPNTRVAKNVILFLGDGMGVSTVTAARIYKGQKSGQPGEETQLHFETFPNVALSKTYNVNKQTPDSAGTGTAFLCGVKTNTGTLGVDSRVTRTNCSQMNDPDVYTESMLDWSFAAGKSVGLVSTARITHATPAASYAHIPDRDWEKDTDIPAECEGVKDIAFQLLKNNSQIQVMLGGGRNEFYNRADNRALPEEWLSEMQAMGRAAQYVQNASQFRAVSAADTDYLLGLFSGSHMTYELLRDNEQEPSIVEMTSKAIQILRKNSNGFFLLVEGGRIDHGHHENWAKRALEETVAFDNAVAAATQMTGEDTLIVVTADHSHVFSIAGYPSRGNDILGLVDEITPGKGPTDNMPYTALIYGNGGSNGRENLTLVNTTADDYRFSRAVPLPLGWETHSAEDVAIYATGPMAHLFRGVKEQNFIAHAMAYAACVGPNTGHCDNPNPDPVCTGGAVEALRAGGVLGTLLLVSLVFLVA